MVKWRAKRKTSGLPARTYPWIPKDLKKYRSAQKEWASRPLVRKRKAAQMKSYRKTPRLQIKFKARIQVMHALEAGKLKRQACGECGAKRAEAHHPDYSKPLEVVWLCKPCHTTEHAVAKERSR